MVTRQELEIYLQDWLKTDQFQDYAPNGLQIQGIEEIGTICTAVTASLEAIEKAVALNAQALLVHHGYFWKGESPIITGIKQARIKGLLDANLNLFAFHLPLDCHPLVGNNACIGRLLGFDALSSHTAGGIDDLLWVGHYPHAQPVSDYLSFLAQQFKREPQYVGSGDKPVRRVAWCSGGAQDFIVEAHALKADTYISGEISERTYYQAVELGMNYFACGHHATERLGIQALGEHLAHQFHLVHHFIDSDNPV